MKDLRYLNSHRIFLKEFENFEYDETCEGMFDILINGNWYFVVASVGEGWQHVSVSGHEGIMPTWDVMDTIKNKFFNDDEFVVEYHPKKEEYVNNVENCLHIWSSLDRELPYPDLNEIRTRKPKLINKQAVRINGRAYYYEHFESEDFEYATIQSFNKRPEWDAVCEIKQQIFGDEVAVSYHARKGDLLYRQNKKKLDRITIWKSTKDKIFTPNSRLVGIQGLTEDDYKNMTNEEILDLI